MKNAPCSIALVAASLAALGPAGCGGVDTRPAEWAYLSPAIFQPNCATTSCHNPAAAVSGLDFSTPAAGYTSLTGLWVWVVALPDAAPVPGLPCSTVNGTKVCEEKLRPLVTPYDPAGSRLVNMLRARDAPRMPPDRPLDETDIELVERWILNGACRTGSTCVTDAAPAKADATATGDGGGHRDGSADGRGHADGNGEPADGAADRRVGQ